MKQSVFPRLLNMYLRLALLALSATVGITALAAGARMALAADLKPAVTISGDMLTVGDIFSGISAERAGYILGPAPQPGKTMTLNAQTLTRIALALDLPWQASGSADQVVISRAATMIDADAIKEVLSSALESKGLSGSYDLLFAAAPPVIALPASLPPTLAVKNVRFDAHKNWFEATLVAPSLANPVAERAVSGTVQRYMQIPVLKTSLRNGDIAGPSDLAWIDMRLQDIQPRMLLRADSIVGMTPRRMAEAGKPLLDTELERPQMIERGKLITLIYQSGPIRLTTRGKALQGGAAGDIVQAINVSSNRNIQGLITDKNEITVTE